MTISVLAFFIFILFNYSKHDIGPLAARRTSTDFLFIYLEPRLPDFEFQPCAKRHQCERSSH